MRKSRNSKILHTLRTGWCSGEKSVFDIYGGYFLLPILMSFQRILTTFGSLQRMEQSCFKSLLLSAPGTYHGADYYQNLHGLYLSNKFTFFDVFKLILTLSASSTTLAKKLQTQKIDFPVSDPALVTLSY
jgi:hypothetical protein